MSEYIGQLSGSVSFSTFETIVLNPGLAAWFPWLSTQASDWQQYRFHKLSVHFITQTSTSTGGSVTIAPSYNQTQSAPNTILEALNVADAVNDVSWTNLVCVLEPSLMFPVGPRKLIRSGNVAGDLSVYDAARIFVCTDGQPGTAIIGKLALSYDIELFGPQATSLVDQPTPNNMSVYLPNAVVTIPNDVLTPLAWPLLLYNPLGVSQSGDLTVFTPPKGCYRVWCSISAFNPTGIFFNFEARIFFNGSGTNWGFQTDNGDTTAANAAISQTFFAILPCNGTDSFSVDVASTEGDSSSSQILLLGTALTIELA